MKGVRENRGTHPEGFCSQPDPRSKPSSALRTRHEANSLQKEIVRGSPATFLHLLSEEAVGARPMRPAPYFPGSR